MESTTPKSSNKWTIAGLVIVLLLLIIAAIVILVLWWRGYEFYTAISTAQCHQLDYDCLMDLASKYRKGAIEWMHKGHHIMIQLNEGIGEIAVNGKIIPFSKGFSITKFFKQYYSLGDNVYVNGNRIL